MSDFESAWHHAASIVHRHASGDPSEEWWESRSLKSHLKAYVKLSEAAGWAWTDAMSERVRAQVAVLLKPRAPYRGHEVVAKAKATFLGHAVASGDLSRVSDSEARALVRLGLLAPDLAPKTTTPAPAAGAGFRVRYDVLDRAGRNPARVGCDAWVERVHPAEAPRAWTLPFSRGTRALGVRSLRGAPIRPLMAPGQMRPMTEAEFVAASRGDDAWRDNPFGVRNPSAASLSLPWITGARSKSGADPTYAPRLLSIDGIVYRGTEWPRFGVVERQVGTEIRLSVEWSVGDLHSLSSADVIGVHKASRSPEANFLYPGSSLRALGKALPAVARARRLPVRLCLAHGADVSKKDPLAEVVDAVSAICSRHGGPDGNLAKRFADHVAAGDAEGLAVIASEFDGDLRLALTLAAAAVRPSETRRDHDLEEEAAFVGMR